jgi:hypothetical protein
MLLFAYQSISVRDILLVSQHMLQQEDREEGVVVPPGGKDGGPNKQDA